MKPLKFITSLIFILMERNYNQTILKVIAQKLGVDESDVLPQSELVADFGADSLDLVEIMMKL